MSGIRKGGNRKSAASSSSKNTAKKSTSSSSGSLCCFAGCGTKITSPDALVQHYEKCFSTNDKKHIQALEKLDSNFSLPTSCQICTSSFAHSGILLQHVFQLATTELDASNADDEALVEQVEMHMALFQSFIQELLTMQSRGVGRHEESIVYLLSLLVPDYEPEEEEYEEGDEKETDEDEDEYGNHDEEPSLDELEQFESFLAAHGFDVDDIVQDGGGRGKKAGAGASEKQREKLMREMMKQMSMEGGGMHMEDEDEDEEDSEDADDEEEERRAAAAASAKAKSKSSSAAAASSAPSPGDLKCSDCNQMRNKTMYSAAQIKKKGKRRCKICTDGATATGTSAASAAAASSSAKSAAAPSSSKPHSHAHTQQPHRNNHHNIDSGIQSEPEEFDGDGEAELRDDTTDEDDGGDEDDEEYDPNDDDDDDDEYVPDDDEEEYDDDDDPFSAIFGGGRRARPTRSASAAQRRRMSMHILIERPGQLLTRDRRLRLKPSVEYPIRTWRPTEGVHTCTTCWQRVPSRFLQEWKLTCLQCAEARGWIQDPLEDDDDDDDDEHDHPHTSSRRAKSQSARYHAYTASLFPLYRGGMTHCAKSECASENLLITYDRDNNEWVVCAECGESAQKLRYFDKSQMKLVDSIQEPILHGY